MRVKLAYLVGPTSFTLELEHLRSSGIKECRRHNRNNNISSINNHRTWLRLGVPADTCLLNITNRTILPFRNLKV